MIQYWMTAARKLHTDETVAQAAAQQTGPIVLVVNEGIEGQLAVGSLVGWIAQAPDGRFLCGRLNRGRAYLSVDQAPKLYRNLRVAQWGVRRFGRSDKTFTFIPLYETTETYQC